MGTTPTSGDRPTALAERIEAAASGITIAAGATLGLVASDERLLGLRRGLDGLAGIVVGAGVFSTIYYGARRIVRPASGRN